MKIKYLPILALVVLGMSAHAGDYGKWFEKTDTNADGYLSADELGAEKAHKIDKIDLDGDRLISLDELKQYKANKKKRKDGTA